MRLHSIAFLIGLLSADLAVAAPQAPSPQPRFLQAMAYDAARQRVVLFGGGATQPQILSDTWEHDGQTWIQAAPTNVPGPRHGCQGAFEILSGRTIVFGGGGTAGLLNDTWAWDGVGWQLLTPAASPSPRNNYAMAYDVNRARVVMFGGYDGSTRVNDTWEFNGTTWLQRSPSAAPSPRDNISMAYDRQRGVSVLFGGYPGSGLLNDTWEWDGTNWVRRYPPTTPGARADVAMAYDAARGVIVMFGGYAWGLSNQTWTYDGLDWQLLNPSWSPSPRQHARMVYDDARGVIVLFGGTVAYTQHLGDTWLFDGSQWMPAITAAAQPYGSGCGSPPLTLTGDPAARPVIGQTAAATVSNCPTPLVLSALGWSRTWWNGAPLPLSLAPYGAPGCFLLQSMNLGYWWPTPYTSPGTARFTWAIPYLPFLVGQSLKVQSWAIAPGANAAGLVTSNGLEWRFGSQ